MHIGMLSSRVTTSRLTIVMSSVPIHHHVSCCKFAHPKRRFWKAEQTFCAFSKHFSRVWVLDLGYKTLKSASKTHSENIIIVSLKRVRFVSISVSHSRWSIILQSSKSYISTGWCAGNRRKFGQNTVENHDNTPMVQPNVPLESTTFRHVEPNMIVSTSSI
jgi:hypothetical protein